MKLDLKTWLLILLALALVISIVTRPTNQVTDLTPFKTEIAILEADRREEQALFRSIIEKSKERTIKDSIALNAKDKRIAVLEKRAAQERTPRVDTLIRNNPDLESFVNTQSEIIQEQKEAIDTLKSSLEFQKQVNRDLVQNHEAEARISKRIEGEQDKVIAKLEKVVKKKTNGNKFWKSVAVGLGVGGFLLGSQL